MVAFTWEHVHLRTPSPPQVPSATTIAFLTAPRNVSIELIQRG